MHTHGYALPAFVTRFTAEELPQHLKKLIEVGLQEWEKNLCKVIIFFEVLYCS